MDLAQQDGGAIVEIGKYDLPDPLPGAPVGGAEERGPRRIRSRHQTGVAAAVLRGTVTTSIETQLKDTRLYLGEWLSWDNAAVRVSLVSDGPDFALEAHIRPARK